MYSTNMPCFCSDHFFVPVRQSILFNTDDVLVPVSTNAANLMQCPSIGALGDPGPTSMHGVQAADEAPDSQRKAAAALKSHHLPALWD